MNPVKPSPSGYTSLATYLTAHYQWRKSTDAKFSYGSWSQELNLQSKSFLRMVTLGHRTLTDRLIPIFIKNLNLAPAEVKTFESLTRFSQSKTLVEREYHLSALLQSQSKPSGTNSNDATLSDYHEYVSDPIVPRTFTLLSELSDSGCTVDELSKVLEISVARAKHAISVLSRLELLDSSADVNGQRYIAKKGFVKVDQHLGSTALQTFHKRSMEQAIAAIDAPVESRRFMGMICALTPEQLQTLQSALGDFLESQLNALKQSRPLDTTSSVQLYQFNSQIFAVSQPIAIKPEPILPSEKSSLAPVGQPKPSTTP